MEKYDGLTAEEWDEKVNGKKDWLTYSETREALKEAILEEGETESDWLGFFFQVADDYGSLPSRALEWNFNKER